MSNIVVTAELRQQVYDIIKRMEVADDVVCRVLRGWERIGARKGISNEAYKKMALLADSCYDGDYEEDYEDIVKFGKAVRGAVEDYDKPADGDYGLG